MSRWPLEYAAAKDSESERVARRRPSDRIAVGWVVEREGGEEGEEGRVVSRKGLSFVKDEEQWRPPRAAYIIDRCRACGRGAETGGARTSDSFEPRPSGGSPAPNSSGPGFSSRGMSSPTYAPPAPWRACRQATRQSSVCAQTALDCRKTMISALLPHHSAVAELESAVFAATE